MSMPKTANISVTPVCNNWFTAVGHDCLRTLRMCLTCSDYPRLQIECLLELNSFVLYVLLQHRVRPDTLAVSRTCQSHHGDSEQQMQKQLLLASAVSPNSAPQNAAWPISATSAASTRWVPAFCSMGIAELGPGNPWPDAPELSTFCCGSPPQRVQVN